MWISAIPVSNAALFPPKISWFAVLDRMREAGLSFDEIEAVVAALEREQEGQR